MKRYLSARTRAVGHALRGIRTLLSTQAHARLHLIISILVVIIGFILHLSRWEWIAILLCIGLVLMAEAMNTGLEFLADEVSLDHSELIGKAKDVAAAGVLISVAVSVLIGCMILWSHLI